LGVNFLEKKLPFDDADINLMIWDLGGQKGNFRFFCLKTLEFREMLDLVCNDALAILFMFDLSRKATLHSVKEWYMQSRKFNKKGKNLPRN
jgi:Gtp-binding protein of the ras superfamily involved in termination of M-phase